MPAPILYVRSIGKNHTDVRLKQVEDGLPVAPRALHDGMRTSFGDESCGKPFEFVDDGAELLDLRAGFVRPGRGNGRDSVRPLS